MRERKGVVVPCMAVPQPRSTGSTCGENVRQLRSKTIPPTGRLFLVVIIVGAGEKVPKNKLWHVHLMLLVNFNWDAGAVVPNGNCSFLLVDVNLPVRHVSFDSRGQTSGPFRRSWLLHVSKRQTK